MPTPAEDAARYNAEYRRIRTDWQHRINTLGEVVPCWRCSGPIDSTVPFDIGHNGPDVMGPEHRHPTPAWDCPGNRGEAATRGNRLRTTPPGTPSRTW